MPETANMKTYKPSTSHKKKKNVKAKTVLSGGGAKKKPASY